MRAACLTILCAGALAGQSVRVYSEFQRIDPFGNVVALDATESAREVLSPMVVRNAWASFQAAVTIPQGVPSFLYVLQNPEWFRVEVSRELFAKTAAGWVPDGL